jgi:HK97 family phage prohead protease
MTQQKLEYIINTEDVNSYGFVILNSSLDFSEFDTNSVLLWNHNSDEPIGSWTDRQTKNGNLVMSPQFDLYDSNSDPLAYKIYSKCMKGLVKGTSLGVDIEDYIEEDDVMKVTKCKVIEISLTALPSNLGCKKLSYRGTPIEFKSKEELKINLNKMSNNIIIPAVKAETKPVEVAEVKPEVTLAVEVKTEEVIKEVVTPEVKIEVIPEVELKAELVVDETITLKAEIVELKKKLSEKEAEEIKKERTALLSQSVKLGKINTEAISVLEKIELSIVKELMSKLSCKNNTNISTAKLNVEKLPYATYDEWREKDSEGLLKFKKDDFESYKAFCEKSGIKF